MEVIEEFYPWKWYNLKKKENNLAVAQRMDHTGKRRHNKKREGCYGNLWGMAVIYSEVIVVKMEGIMKIMNILKLISTKLANG